MAKKYIGDVWQLKWSDLYSSQVVVLYKIGEAGTWVQITNEAPNGNDSTVVDPENPAQQDPHSGHYDWTIDLAENALAVYCRVADKDLWDPENPDDGEYVDYGPFDIEQRVLTTLMVIGRSKIAFGKTAQYTVIGYDQTGAAIATGTVTWSATGGTITDGLFTAGETEGNFEVTAEVGSISDTAEVKVVEKISTAKLTGGLRIGVSIRA